MRTSGGEILTQEELMYQAAANTTSVLKISPEVPAYIQSQILSIRAFNDSMVTSSDEGAPDTNDALFGTHLREAARVIRGLLH
jgi:hypothetical protein